MIKHRREIRKEDQAGGRQTTEAAAAGKEIFDAFGGQQQAFGYSQATEAGDTIYVAATAGNCEGMRIPGPMAEQMKPAYQQHGKGHLRS